MDNNRFDGYTPNSEQSKEDQIFSSTRGYANQDETQEVDSAQVLNAKDQNRAEPDISPEVKQEQTDAYRPYHQQSNTYANNGYYTSNTSQNNTGNSSNAYSYGDNYRTTGTQSPYNTYRYAQGIQPAINQQYQVPKAEPKTKKKKSRGVATVITCVLLSGVVGFGGGFAANHLASNGVISSGDGMVVQRVVTTAEPVKGDASEMTTEQIAEATANSVVEITTEVVQTGTLTKQYITSGAGSGVIIAENGYIITNNHVISDAEKIVVTLRDGTTYDAKLIGADSEVDIALLKIEAKGLKAAVLGDSEQIKVGEKTVVIGNPLGQLGGSVTEGIISAQNRDVVLSGVTMDVLQTSAAINPGNSGGGLFNSRGELIGVVVAKAVDEQVEGLGFAIPINHVSDILSDLKEHGYVTGRPQIGVELIDVANKQTAMMYGVNEIGVYVSGVTSVEAQQAGFQTGDRIVSVGGEEVSTISEVKNKIQKSKVGDEIEIEVDRNGTKTKLSLTLGEQTPAEKATQPNNNGFNNPYSDDRNYGGNGNNGGSGNSAEDFFNNFF